MKTYLVQPICWGGLLTVLSACPSKEPDAVGAVIETAIPNGLVPGSALTLKGRDFGTVQSVTFANTTVAVGSFIRTATDEVTLKVPIGTQAGEVRVVGEKGPGQPKTMAMLTGNLGITADNVSTNVNTYTQSSYSDACSPRWFSYCMTGSCLSFYDGYSGGPQLGGVNCERFNPTVEQIAGSTYKVYAGKNQNGELKLTLKCEVNKNSAGFTGLVIIETSTGKTYFGSVFKNWNVVGYSTDGSELKLCRPVNDANRYINYPCVQITCPTCL